MITFTRQEPAGQIVSLADLLSSIAQLHCEIEEERQADAKLYFRGHAKASYLLIPTIGREHCYGGKKRMFSTDDELMLLHRFRRRSYTFFERAISPVEAIFLARQHGMPTRLIDWTANALFALYFACSEYANDDGRLWVMLPRETRGDIDVFDLIGTASEEELFEQAKNSGIRILFPFFNSPRAVAQEGIYTVHPDPWRPLDCYRDEPFEEDHLDIERLYAWSIPSGAKIDILRQLSSSGLTRRTVYPDLDGIARSLWETQVLWKP
jgi:hypothetical protein